jgi:hypothetical protein
LLNGASHGYEVVILSCSCLTPNAAHRDRECGSIGVRIHEEGKTEEEKRKAWRGRRERAGERGAGRREESFTVNIVSSRYQAMVG